MAKKKRTSKVKVAALSSEEVKQKILCCAKQAFSHVGYLGANLKDIAKCANVAGSLINYHYKDKAGLFKACMEIFAKTRMEAVNRILVAEPKSREQMQTRIELFVEEMLLSYLNDPNGFDMIRSEMRAENPAAIELFRETFLISFQNACEFIKKAQENNLIDKKWEPIIMAKLLFMLSCDAAQNDHLAKRFFNVTVHDESWRKKMAEHIVHVFMNGVAK